MVGSIRTTQKFRFNTIIISNNFWALGAGIFTTISPFGAWEDHLPVLAMPTTKTVPIHRTKMVNTHHIHEYNVVEGIWGTCVPWTLREVWAPWTPLIRILICESKWKIFPCSFKFWTKENERANLKVKVNNLMLLCTFIFYFHWHPVWIGRAPIITRTHS